MAKMAPELMTEASMMMVIFDSNSPVCDVREVVEDDQNISTLNLSSLLYSEKRVIGEGFLTLPTLLTPRLPYPDQHQTVS